MTQPAARTLTRKQYLGTAAGKRDENYNAYLHYVAKRRAQNVATLQADPFAQMPEPTIQARIKSIVGRLPQPLDQAQIQSRAQGMLDPIVQRLTQGFETQGKNAAATISGYSNALSSELGKSAPAGVNAAYAPAEQATAATNAALADRLSGAGNATGDDLAKRLASIGDPTVAATADQVRNNAAGASNASFAGGTASLEQLLGNHATASDYAGKIPGLVDLSGVQRVGEATGAINKQLGDALTEVSGQLPGIVQGLQSMSDTRANNRTQLTSDLYQALTGQNITRATAKAGLITDAAKINADASPKPDATLSKTYGYKVDQYGNAIPDRNGNIQTLPGYKVGADGRVTAKPKAGKPGSKKTPQLSAKQVQDYKATAFTVAENAKTGFDTTDSKGVVTHHPPISEAQAYDEMRKEGIPDVIAQAAIKRYYGDRDPATNPAASGPPLPKGLRH